MKFDEGGGVVEMGTYSDIVAKPLPATQALHQFPAADPVAPPAVHDTPLEQWAGKEEGGEEEWSDDIR